MDVKEYGLDLHCTMILEEYRELLPVFNKMKEVVLGELRSLISRAGLYVSGSEARVKEEASLAGKLELKGSKYRTISDLTDIVGARVITFYSEEVDKIASLVEGVSTWTGTSPWTRGSSITSTVLAMIPSTISAVSLSRCTRIPRCRN